MKSVPFLRIRLWPLIVIPVCAWGLLGASGSNAPAEPVPVRHVEGTVHGFLELRSEEGHVLASGDFVQVAHGDQVTLRTLFNFKDGSIDDETTVFSQRRTFELLTDHHIQKGPSFPHPIDMSIDRRSGQVTVRTFGKDGKEEAKTDHLTLPPDLANGIVSNILENIPPHTPETTVSMVVATPKPRIVKLVMSPRGEDPFSVFGSSHQAIHYEIKIDLGGIPGVVAPLVGKQPPNIQVWVVGGQAPTFVREQGPIYPDGPMMTIELASPVWQDSPKSGD